MENGEVTVLLKAWSGGDAAALDRLTPLIYNELHRIAHGFMARERTGNTLQSTALVNEAWLRLVDVNRIQWRDRAHFFAIAARMMRRIVVDSARARTADKRGAGLPKVNLDDIQIAIAGEDANLVALDDALKTLAEIDKRKVEVIELRFFAGLSVEETAEVLKVSEQTVHRDWKLARAWLSREMAS